MFTFKYYNLYICMCLINKKFKKLLNIKEKKNNKKTIKIKINDNY